MKWNKTLYSRAQTLLKKGDASGWSYVREVLEVLRDQDVNYIQSGPIRDLFVDQDLQDGLLSMWEEILPLLSFFSK